MIKSSAAIWDLFCGVVKWYEICVSSRRNLRIHNIQSEWIHVWCSSEHLWWLDYACEISCEHYGYMFIAINENFHQCNAVVHPCVFNWIHLAFVIYRNELQHGLVQCNLNAAHYVRFVHSMCRREAITWYGLVSKSADLLGLWLNLSWWSVWTNAMLNLLFHSIVLELF